MYFFFRIVIRVIVRFDRINLLYMWCTRARVNLKRKNRARLKTCIVRLNNGVKMYVIRERANSSFV